MFDFSSDGIVSSAKGRGKLHGESFAGLWPDDVSHPLVSERGAAHRLGVVDPQLARRKRRRKTSKLSPQKGTGDLVVHLEGQSEAGPPVQRASPVNDARNRGGTIEPKARGGRPKGHDDLFARKDVEPSATAPARPMSFREDEHATVG
jgi:hypothetical protein